MKKIFFLGIVLIFVVSVTSCHSASYTTNTGANGMLDFTQGRWVFNTPECINCGREAVDLENFFMDFFTDCIGDSIVTVHQERKKNLIPERISFEPTQAELKKISEGTDAPYLITVKGAVLKEEFGSMGYEPKSLYDVDENIAEVSIAFYDLKTQTQIHYISTRGKVSVSKGNDDEDEEKWVFAQNAYGLFKKSMKKNIKKLKQNCKCK